MVTTGASISTVEASIGLSPGRLKTWLIKGQNQPKTPYRIFYTKFRKWAAEAKAAAESQQLAKAPSQWLERNSAAKLIESADEAALIPANNQQIDAGQVLKLGVNQALAALKVLSEQGINIDDALRKDMIHLNEEPTNEDKGNNQDQ